MFACGVYPTFPAFLKSVRAEAECNVKRLRHHPCIVLFCGNNEDCKLPSQGSVLSVCAEKSGAIDQQILQWDFEQKGDPLPARLIYEEILPEIVGRLTEPPIDYWFGSPYGGEGWDTTDPTVGDIVSS